MSSSSEDESGLQELQSEGEMTPTTSSSLEGGKLFSKTQYFRSPNKQRMATNPQSQVMNSNGMPTIGISQITPQYTVQQMHFMQHQWVPHRQAPGYSFPASAQTPMVFQSVYPYVTNQSQSHFMMGPLRPPAAGASTGGGGHGGTPPQQQPIQQQSPVPLQQQTVMGAGGSPAGGISLGGGGGPSGHAVGVYQPVPMSSMVNIGGNVGQPTVQNKSKPRLHHLPILDPVTGKNLVSEMLKSEDNSGATSDSPAGTEVSHRQAVGYSFPASAQTQQSTVPLQQQTVMGAGGSPAGGISLGGGGGPSGHAVGVYQPVPMSSMVNIGGNVGQPTIQNKSKHRLVALPIIDPVTGKNIREMLESEENSGATSDSPARIEIIDPVTGKNIREMLESEENSGATSDSPTETKDLNEKIIRLLDNLTPHNCEVISKDLLPYLDSLDKIEVIVKIIFEKGVSGESNASIYAKLYHNIYASRGLQMKQKANLLLFRKTLVRMCQNEFEKDKSKEFGVEANLMEIVKEPLEEKRTALRKQLVDNVQKFRMRSLGLCRFLGELYLVGALGLGVMICCIEQLLNSAGEQDLECLCTLMKIIGKKLEENDGKNSEKIEEYFHKMDNIINKGKTSPDISIMWKEIILLKNNGWIPREGSADEKDTEGILQEETDTNLQSSNQTFDECNLPKNNSKSDPLVEEKENKNAAETVKDVNILSSNINTSSNGITSIAYEEGQWSPVNPLGKKKYGSDFLHRLRYSPLSVKNPNLTVKTECILPYNQNRIQSGKNKNSSFSEPILKTNPDLERDLSQQAVILEIKSNETETTGKHSSDITENIEEEVPEVEDEESLKLRKTMEEIVACLQRTNADEVALKIMKLQIGNEYHLKVVVNAIFEQAIIKTRIAGTFAGLSLYLNNANFGWQAMKEGEPNDNLKKSLLECFQKEFQRYSSETALSVFHIEQKLRLRGIISYFGHLYMIGMISDPILVMGIKHLLKCGDDYSLEILCNILSETRPIGKE